MLEQATGFTDWLGSIASVVVGDIVWSATCAGIGGIILIWVLLAVYTRKILNQARADAVRQAQLNTLLLQIMELNGWAKLKRDENGEIVGATVKSGGGSEGESE